VGDLERSRPVLAGAAAAVPGARTISAQGDPARSIVEVARGEGCDLIVVGNKGMTGARRFLGSVPSKVARHAACHTLLVKTT
jgi:nucleotide-binding universal stress UspA family protein